MRISFLPSAARAVFCLLFILLAAWGAMGQERGGQRPMVSITGKVVDEQGTTIPYAAVAVQGQREGSALQGSATDMDGQFAIEVRPGTYTITVTFLSYEEWKKEGVTVGEGGLKLGTITMKPKTELVDEVVITAERNQMELMMDRRVFNVAKDPTNAGSNAQEILSNLPSINVDMDGNVSMRGSQNVRILIDGKPSGLTGISTADALRQLPGSIIERVEVVTNASARYDAEGEAGIINIILKKDRRAGLNGSFEVNTGWPHNHGGSFNINYRKGKFNLFTGLGVQYNQSPGGGSSYQKFVQEDTTFAYGRKREQLRGGLAGNYRLGVDFNIDEKTSITASGMMSRHWQQNDYTLSYTDFDENDVLTDLVVRSEDEQAEKDNYEANLNFTRTFKTPEQKLTADVRWFISSDHEKSDIDERGDTYGTPLIQRIDNFKRERMAGAVGLHTPLQREGEVGGGRAHHIAQDRQRLRGGAAGQHP